MHCEACAGVKGRDTIEIDHRAGEEIQWDWFQRRGVPRGATDYVLLGTLPTRGGVLSEKVHVHGRGVRVDPLSSSVAR